MLERFLHGFARFVFWWVGRSIETKCWIVNWSPFLQFSKPWPNRKSNRSSVTCRIKWEALKDKEVRKQFAFSISSKFKQLPEASEDMEKEWLLLRSAIILSAAESCGRKRLIEDDDSEKKDRIGQTDQLQDRQIVIWFAIPVHWEATSGNFGSKEI